MEFKLLFRKQHDGRYLIRKYAGESRFEYSSGNLDLVLELFKERVLELIHDEKKVIESRKRKIEEMREYEKKRGGPRWAVEYSERWKKPKKV
jgi:hypothetical protein